MKFPASLVPRNLEKTKNVQEITQDTEKRKRLELMEELISVSNYASIMMAKNYGKL